jgi:hypothetical protein
MCLSIQSLLNIPAGATRTYITETIADPGSNCCQGPNCGTLSGNTSLNLGTCTTGSNRPGQVVRATETSNLQQYFAITDAGGNYMINAPFGTYSVGLGIPGNLVCGPPTSSYTLNAGTPTILGINMLLADTCMSDLYLTTVFPGTVLPSNCGVSPQTPCPGDNFRYCFTLLNNGTSTIPTGTNFPYMIPTGFTITGITQTPAAAWTTPLTTTGTAILTTPVAPGQSAGFCIDVFVPLTATPPWSSFMTADGFAACVNTEPLFPFVSDLDEVSCACDPNHKSAQPMGCGPNHVIGLEPLTYTVEFNNIGTGPAERVVVIDRIDGDLDLASLRVLESAYPITDIRVQPATGYPGQYELHFIFDHIQLPPLALDPQAIGRITYRILPRKGLSDGTLIENFAAIYFDDLAPVITNTVFHTCRAQPRPNADLGSNLVLYNGYSPACITIGPAVTGGSPPYTYAWSNGASSSSQSVCPTSTTTYSVTVTDAEGCSAATELEIDVIDVSCGKKRDKVILCHNGHEICVSPHAVAAHLNHGDQLGPCPSSGNHAKADLQETPRLLPSPILEVFPNPADQQLRVELALPTAGPAKLTLHGLDGKQVALAWSGSLSADVLQRLSLDLSALPPGIYALRLQGIDIQLVRRVVIAH